MKLSLGNLGSVTSFQSQLCNLHRKMRRTATFLSSCLASLSKSIEPHALSNKREHCWWLDGHGKRVGN